VVDHDQAAVEAVYEAAMLAELKRILDSIPHADLALQWDTAVEFGIYEGRFPSWFGDARSGIVERLLRLGARVPSDVELGYHLCYGDAKHRHFKEPDDAAKLVDIANALSTGVGRPLQWIHMPVPRSRDDDAYFAPLRELRIDDETELYLGLVHNTDGVEGTRRRIQTAQKVRERFGVATECGMGRRPPETIPELLRIHAAVSR
jgi:methionine synthase II (cobalamin-independent)